jgi:hypothetical protein
MSSEAYGEPSCRSQRSCLGANCYIGCRGCLREDSLSSGKYVTARAIAATPRPVKAVPSPAQCYVNGQPLSASSTVNAEWAATMQGDANPTQFIGWAERPHFSLQPLGDVPYA